MFQDPLATFLPRPHSYLHAPFGLGSHLAPATFGPSTQASGPRPLSLPETCGVSSTSIGGLWWRLRKRLIEEAEGIGLALDPEFPK